MTERTANSEDMMRYVAVQLAEQEANTKTFLKKGVQVAPVPDEVLNKLLWMVGHDVHDVMCCHPGYASNRKIESVNMALVIYNRCHQDLLATLDEFDIASQDSSLFGRPRVDDLKGYETSCRKEIFALSCAAAALVSMVRHVRGCMDIPGLGEALEKYFDMAQHEFVKELRNNLSHVTFHESSWAIKNTGEARTSHFQFNNAKLLNDGDFNEAAQQYIAAQHESIDVRALFESYYDRVDAFYAWLVPEIENRLTSEVTDFRRCMKKIRANSVKCWYRLVFSQMVGPETDLHSHLRSYLTQDELQEINELPQNSKEQIDRIIEMLDEYEACDDELRLLIYRAFNVQTCSEPVEKR